jgi:hypothetical protein
MLWQYILLKFELLQSFNGSRPATSSEYMIRVWAWVGLNSAGPGIGCCGMISKFGGPGWCFPPFGLSSASSVRFGQFCLAFSSTSARLGAQRGIQPLGGWDHLLVAYLLQPMSTNKVCDDVWHIQSLILALSLDDSEIFLLYFSVTVICFRPREWDYHALK